MTNKIGMNKVGHFPVLPVVKSSGHKQTEVQDMSHRKFAPGKRIPLPLKVPVLTNSDTLFTQWLVNEIRNGSYGKNSDVLWNQYFSSGFESKAFSDIMMDVVEAFVNLEYIGTGEQSVAEQSLLQKWLRVRDKMLADSIDESVDELIMIADSMFHEANDEIAS